MSTVAEPKKQTAIGNHMAFEIAVRNTRKNGYIRDDTRGTSNIVSLNSPARMPIMLESRHYDEKKRSFVPIQYVPSAPTIFLNDYEDENGVMQKGLLSLGLAREGKDGNGPMINRLASYASAPLSFKDGILDLRKYGGDSDPNLVLFVNLHEDNAESPAGMRRAPNVLQMFKFRPIRAEETAAKKVSSFEDEFAGAEIVKNLRSKQSDGQFVYDEVRMNAVLTILGMKLGSYGPDSKAQKFGDILRAMQGNPAAFAALVNESTKDVELLIGKAVALEILQVSTKSVNIKIGGSKPVEIYEFPKGTKDTDRISTLALALMGDPLLSNHAITIRTEVESAG